MKIGVIVGSGRKNSYNEMLGNLIKYIGKDKEIEVELLDIKSLPMYSEDIELDPIKSVDILRGKVKESDGIIFITPEHNQSIPALLKNAIDWLSRVDKVLIGKPSMIVGASMGFLGTVNAQNHLRSILNSPGIGTFTLPGNQVYIGTVHEKFDKDGNIIDKNTKDFLETTFEEFIKWIEKIK